MFFVIITLQIMSMQYKLIIVSLMHEVTMGITYYTVITPRAVCMHVQAITCFMIQKYFHDKLMTNNEKLKLMKISCKSQKVCD